MEQNFFKIEIENWWNFITWITRAYCDSLGNSLNSNEVLIVDEFMLWMKRNFITETGDVISLQDRFSSRFKSNFSNSSNLDDIRLLERKEHPYQLRRFITSQSVTIEGYSPIALDHEQQSRATRPRRILTYLARFVDPSERRRIQGFVVTSSDHSNKRHADDRS